MGKAISDKERIKELETERDNLLGCLNRMGDSIGKFERDMHDQSLKVGEDIIRHHSMPVSNIILNMKFGNMSNVSFCELFRLKEAGCRYDSCTECIHGFLKKAFMAEKETEAITWDKT